MRVDALWILFSVAGPLVGAVASESSDSTKATLRHLQNVALPQTLNYRANYSADFQYFSDVLCDGPAPLLYVTCFGKNMTILNTSDESIMCSLMDEPLVENGTSYECINTCVDTECQNIYRHKSDTLAAIDGPFGSIYFLCESDTLEQIDSFFLYTDSETSNGTCAASSSLSARGRNYHVGRLGVSCPVAVGSTREYLYDDTYADCISRGSFTLDISEDFSDVFACVNGMICEGQECSFPFLPFRIHAYVPKFYDTCVESLGGIPVTSFPTMAPATSPFEFSSQFEASWGTFYEPIESQASCSGSQALVVAISCDSGARINLINSTDGVANCAETGSNEISCFTNQDVVNRFASVFYECVGPQLSATRLAFPEASVTCTNIAEMTIVRNMVTLGVACESSTSSYYYYSDLLFECAESNHDFDKIFDDYGIPADEVRLACRESASFAIGSTLSQVIPAVGVSTNDYWRTGSDGYCFDQTPVQRSPSAPTTSQPVAIPATPSPTVTRRDFTPAPTDVRALQPTSAPITLAVPLNMVAPTSPPTETKSSGAVIGAAIGGVVGGIAVMAAVGYFLLRRKPSTASGKSEVARRLSATDSAMALGTSQDHNGASSTSSSMPTTSIIQTRPNYQVTYKDQSRSVIPPIDTVSREHLPMAVAVAMEDRSVARPPSVRSQPPGGRLEP